MSDPVSFFTVDNHLTYSSDIDFNLIDVKKAILDVSASAVFGPGYFAALSLNKYSAVLSSPIYII